MARPRIHSQQVRGANPELTVTPSMNDESLSADILNFTKRKDSAGALIAVSRGASGRVVVMILRTWFQGVELRGEFICEKVLLNAFLPTKITT